MEEKKPWYKRPFLIMSLILIGLVVIIEFAISVSPDDAKTEATSSKKKHKLTASESESIKKYASSKVASINQSAASDASEAADSTVSAAESSYSSAVADLPVAKDLSTGTWTAGKDFKGGYYKITSTGGSGNLQSDSGSINTILGQYADNELGQVDSYTGVINDGDVLTVSGMQGVHLEPVDASKPIDLSNISAGVYLVGKNNIPAGRYTITAIQGSGNVMSDDGSINEIMGTTPDTDLGKVTTITVELTKNELISTDLEQISLTKQ